MANRISNAIPQGNMKLLQNQRKQPKGSPKMAPRSSKPTKTSITKIANGTRSGDVVSDDSDDGDDEDASSADDDEDDDPDDFALSGAAGIGNGASSRLAGLSPADVDMLDDGQAAAGADQLDDDYAAVDDISDGDGSGEDESEKKVLRSAEQDLIAEFERTERPRTATAVTNEMTGLSLGDGAAEARRTSVQSTDSQQYDDLDLDLDFNEDPFRGLQSHDTLYQEMIGDAEGLLNDGMGLWRLDEQSRENSAPSSVTQKRVRFDDANSSRTSSMSSSEADPRDSFPDLFDDYEAPSLQNSLLLNGDAILDNESVYDFEDEFSERPAYEIDDEDSDLNSDDSDSSFDSDDGDTTDEEDGEVLIARVKAMRNAAQNASTPASTPNSAPSTPVPGKRTAPNLQRAKTTNGRLTTPKANSGKPRMGTFVRDPTKARVEADIQGSGVKVTCPPNPPERDRAYWERARKAMGSRDGSPNGSLTCVRTTPRTASIPQRPFTARSTLGTMFDGNLDFLRNNDENGIAEELIMSGNNHSMRSSFTSTTFTDDSTAEVENMINLEDFVQMDDSDFDMDEPQSAGIMSPSSEMLDGELPNNANLLGHFDQRRGLVSSFRNNQNHARHVSSLAAHPAKRAQTSEANALQKGRRAAANTPMTPARKNRGSQDVIAGIRKMASPLIQKHHRRSRGNSLSGIHQTLAVDRFSGKTN